MHTDMDQDGYCREHDLVECPCKEIQTEKDRPGNDAQQQKVMAMIAAAKMALALQRQWLEDLTGIDLQPKEEAPQDGRDTR